MFKKLGHGSNYGGKPTTLASQSKLPLEVVSAFQPLYFGAFPAHQQWQEWVPQELVKKGYLISVGGRKRWFLGHRSDPETIRAALAYDPQETLAKVVNTAMLRIWHAGYSVVMMHDHDALTFAYPEEQEDEIIPRLMEDLIVDIPLKNGRTLRIPYDCEVGWNKGHYDARTNPDGLRAYVPGDQGRKRQPQVGILDRVIRRAYG
jgi:DNA polymerase I-like protein with 3'-5' exonuclease and polymerase domains